MCGHFRPTNAAFGASRDLACTCTAAAGGADPPVIAIRGVVRGLGGAAAGLAALPRREIVADFHCVSGWSATDLRWEGVLFETSFAPSSNRRSTPGCGHPPGVRRYRRAHSSSWRRTRWTTASCWRTATGAPWRRPWRAGALGQPRPYGYVSIKHLCLSRSTPGPRLAGGLRRPLIEPHPRARVWHEERHGRFPGRLSGPSTPAMRPSAPLHERTRRGEARERRAGGPPLDHPRHRARLRVEDVWALPARAGVRFRRFRTRVPRLSDVRAAPGACCGAFATCSAAGSASAGFRIRDDGGAWPPGPGTRTVAARPPSGRPARQAAGLAVPRQSFRRSTSPTTTRREVSNRTVYGLMHLAWADRGRPLPGADGRLRQTPRPLRPGVHGVHQAVPLPDRLPRTDATLRTNLVATALTSESVPRQCGLAPCTQAGFPGRYDETCLAASRTTVMPA